MSRKYKNASDIPIKTIVDRLEELSEAVTKGNEAVQREFTMRIPAELDRDADLVLFEASRRLVELQAENERLKQELSEVVAGLFSEKELETLKLEQQAKGLEDYASQLYTDSKNGQIIHGWIMHRAKQLRNQAKEQSK